MTPEVAAFIRAQPRSWGYARLAQACRAAFGDDAPDAEIIRSWWLEHGRIPDPHSRLPRDPELAEAVRDLAGRVTVADIMRALATRFPAERLPSRSALYRCVGAILRPAAPSRDHRAAGNVLNGPEPPASVKPVQRPAALPATTTRRATGKAAQPHLKIAYRACLTVGADGCGASARPARHSAVEIRQPARLCSGRG
jgi:hypothetical protein